MGKQPPREGWSDSPSEVRITVLQDPGDRGLWNRLRARRGGAGRHGRASAMWAAAAAVLAAAVIVTTTSFAGGAGRSHELAAGAGEGGSPGVAAAYGYPTRCLSVTIASSDHAFARADFNHASPCGQYAGYPTAIFHVVRGSWRPVLEAVSYPCPATGIPPAVQRELSVCPQTARSHRPRRVLSGHSRAGHAPWAGTDPSVPR
jgi:hypothetical protein